jgi:hypothetical protein
MTHEEYRQCTRTPPIWYALMGNSCPSFGFGVFFGNAPALFRVHHSFVSERSGGASGISVAITIDYERHRRQRGVPVKRGRFIHYARTGFVGHA